jgi:hypothetical protein
VNQYVLVEQPTDKHAIARKRREALKLKQIGRDENPDAMTVEKLEKGVAESHDHESIYVP